MPARYTKPFDLKIDPAKQYTATIETNHGVIVVKLYASQTPRTVNNFVFLADDGFYDGTTFHRVISNFMAQGGDPTGTGSGGPGYQFADEFDPKLKHDNPACCPWRTPGRNQRQPVLHHLRAHAVARRQAQRLRPGDRGHGCRERHRTRRRHAFSEDCVGVSQTAVSTEAQSVDGEQKTEDGEHTVDDGPSSVFSRPEACQHPADGCDPRRLLGTRVHLPRSDHPAQPVRLHRPVRCRRGVQRQHLRPRPGPRHWLLPLAAP